MGDCFLLPFVSYFSLSVDFASKGPSICDEQKLKPNFQMDALLCVQPGTKQVQIRTELVDKEIFMGSPIIHRRWLSAVIGLSVYPKLIDALLIEKSLIGIVSICLTFKNISQLNELPLGIKIFSLCSCFSNLSKIGFICIIFYFDEQPESKLFLSAHTDNF